MASSINAAIRNDDEYAVLSGLDRYQLAPTRFYETSVRYGRIGILRMLIDRAPLLFESVHAVRLLMIAIKLNRPDIAHMILGMPDMVVPNRAVQRAFSAAVRKGYVDIVHSISLIPNAHLTSAAAWAIDSLKRGDIDMAMAIVPALNIDTGLTGVIETACYRNSVDFVRRLVASVWNYVMPRMSWYYVRSMASRVGDVGLFDEATLKLSGTHRNNAPMLSSWHSNMHLRDAIENDRSENIDKLVTEIVSNGTDPIVTKQASIAGALMYSVRCGSIRSFKTLVDNGSVSNYFTTRDTFISWAAKYDRGSMVDILLSFQGVDNCTPQNFKQSGVYKAFVWAVKARHHRIIELLGASTSLQKFLKNQADIVMLQDAQRKTLAKERKFVSKYATLNMVLPTSIVKHISSFIDTDDTLRYNIAAKHGARNNRLWKLVDDAAALMNRKYTQTPRFSINTVSSAVRTCQEKTRKRPLENAHPTSAKKKRFVIDLTE